MTLATHHIPIVTLDRFLQQPETQPASEFIDGYIYQKPMPQGQHSRLQLKLCNDYKPLYSLLYLTFIPRPQ